MAGILSAIKLTEAGFTDLTVYEKADRVGGTWRENTYPGIACDVPSHLYRYSFAPNPDWSHTFSPGDEIEAYFEQVTKDHDVERCIRFGEEVTRCELVDGRWHLETATGTKDVVDVVIAATGVLHQPRYPDIDGLETFAGHAFHSARWDHSVGSRASASASSATGRAACRSAPRSSATVEHLTLFQRTAQWIVPQDNLAYTEEEKDDFRRHPEKMQELHAGIAELFAAGFGNAVVDADSPHMQIIEDTCRTHLEEKVKDPELAAAPPRLPRRVQAARRVGRLLRRDPAAQRRARHRRDRAHRAEGCAHARRAAPRARRARAGDRLPRSTRSCGRWRSSAVTG